VSHVAINDYGRPKCERRASIVTSYKSVN